jgi:hypothetical protein
MSIEDLNITGKKIMKQIISDYKISPKLNKKILKSIIKVFSQTYHKYQKKQAEKLPHKNFHSLRDFYWLVKSFSILIDQKGVLTSDYNSIFEKAIDFNFSGIYTKKSKENMESENDENLKTSNFLMKKYFKKFLKKSDLENHIQDFLHGESKPKVLSNITRVFKSNLGRYLLLFMDQSYTIELLLENLQK